MPGKILVPLDGSETAEKVLPYARYLASCLKLQLELLMAVDTSEFAANISPENAQRPKARRFVSAQSSSPWTAPKWRSGFFT